MGPNFATGQKGEEYAPEKAAQILASSHCCGQAVILGHPDLGYMVMCVYVGGGCCLELSL